MKTLKSKSVGALDGSKVTRISWANGDDYLLISVNDHSGEHVIRMASSGGTESFLSTTTTDATIGDGNTTAYSIFENGDMDIVAADSDGNRTRDVANSKQNEIEPAIRPGGTQYAYDLSSPNAKNHSVAISDGSVLSTFIPDAPSNVPTSPAWSPSGSVLAFVDCEPSRCRIYSTSISADGGSGAFNILFSTQTVTQIDSLTWKPVPQSSLPRP